MRADINESCSCGAVLIFSESFDKAYHSDTGYRQMAFHKAHAKCRLAQQDTRSTDATKGIHKIATGLQELERGK